MITIVDAGSGVLGYRIEGTIEKRDIEKVVADMDEKVPQSDKVRLYVEMGGMTGMSPQAMLRDLQLGLPRTNYLGRIERVALVTDNDLVRNLAALQSHLPSSMQIRVFDENAAPTAMTWIAAA